MIVALHDVNSSMTAAVAQLFIVRFMNVRFLRPKGPSTLSRGHRPGLRIEGRWPKTTRPRLQKLLRTRPLELKISKNFGMRPALGEGQ